MQNVYTRDRSRGDYMYIHAHVYRYATVSVAPCQVPARIIRGERARNTYALAHSSRNTHIRAFFISDIYVCLWI